MISPSSLIAINRQNAQKGPCCKFCKYFKLSWGVVAAQCMCCMRFLSLSATNKQHATRGVVATSMSCLVYQIMWANWHNGHEQCTKRASLNCLLSCFPTAHGSKQEEEVFDQINTHVSFYNGEKIMTTCKLFLNAPFIYRLDWFVVEGLDLKLLMGQP